MGSNDNSNEFPPKKYRTKLDDNAGYAFGVVYISL